MKPGLLKLLDKIQQDPSSAMLVGRFLALVQEEGDTEEGLTSRLALGKVLVKENARQALKIGYDVHQKLQGSRLPERIRLGIATRELLIMALEGLGRGPEADRIRRLAGEEAGSVAQAPPPLPHVEVPPFELSPFVFQEQESEPQLREPPPEGAKVQIPLSEPEPAAIFDIGFGQVAEPSAVPVPSHISFAPLASLEPSLISEPWQRLLAAARHDPLLRQGRTESWPAPETKKATAIKLFSSRLPQGVGEFLQGLAATELFPEVLELALDGLLDEGKARKALYIASKLNLAWGSESVRIIAQMLPRMLRELGLRPIPWQEGERVETLIAVLQQRQLPL